MLNRRHIRVKVMQTIYAFKGGESDDFSKEEKFLFKSIDNMYSLYLLMMSLLLEIQNKAEDYAEKAQKKHLATQEDKNPNKKFINNQLLQVLKNDVQLKEQIKEEKYIDWGLDSEYVDIIHKELVNSEIYEDYMQTRTSSFKEDKDFVLDTFKEIIAPNDKLYEFIEDKNLTWLDDLPTINTAILKLFRKAKPTITNGFFTPKLYKDLEDRAFASDLFNKTILNQTGLNGEIEKKTKNWDTDRIAQIDNVLLKMGLCELKNFPSIPVKVTINEYLEIAKEYSTPKSSVFINGVLDKIVKEYQEMDNLNKMGRGLM